MKTTIDEAAKLIVGIVEEQFFSHTSAGSFEFNSDIFDHKTKENTHVTIIVSK